MKTFLKFFAMPLLIAVVATVLYIIDSLLAGVFVQDASFMWVGFAVWTVFYGANIKDRIKGLIGIVVGFLSAILMNLITASFSVNVATISISCLLGVFVVNGIVMYMNHLDKFWLSSVTGAFVGIFLTFSGFGVGLNCIASVTESFLMLAILLIYAVFGLICGYISITVQNVVNEKLAKLNENKTDNLEEDKTNNSEKA